MDVLPTVEIFYQSILRPYAHLRVSSVLADNDPQLKLKNENKMKSNARPVLPIIEVDPSMNTTATSGHYYNNSLPQGNNVKFNAPLPNAQLQSKQPKAFSIPSSEPNMMGTLKLPQSNNYQSNYQPFAEASARPVNNSHSYAVAHTNKDQNNDGELTSPIMLSSLSNWGHSDNKNLDINVNTNIKASDNDLVPATTDNSLPMKPLSTLYSTKYQGEEDSLMAAMLCVENLTNFGSPLPAPPAATKTLSIPTYVPVPVSASSSMPTDTTVVSSAKKVVKQSSVKARVTKSEGKENTSNMNKIDQDSSKKSIKDSKKKTKRKESDTVEVTSSKDKQSGNDIKTEASNTKKVKTSSSTNNNGISDKTKTTGVRVADDFCFEKTFKRQILENNQSVIGEASIMQMSELSNFPFEQHSLAATMMATNNQNANSVLIPSLKNSKSKSKQGDTETKSKLDHYNSNNNVHYNNDGSDDASDRSDIHEEIPFMDSDDEFNVLQALDLDFSRSFGRQDMSRLPTQDPVNAIATADISKNTAVKVTDTNNHDKVVEQKSEVSKKVGDDTHSVKSSSVVGTTPTSRLFQHIESIHNQSDTSVSKDGYTNKSTATAVSVGTLNAKTSKATNTTIDPSFRKEVSTVHNKSKVLLDPSIRGTAKAFVSGECGNSVRTQGSVKATESGISESYKASEAVQQSSEISLLIPPVPVDRYDPNILRDLPGHFPVSSHSHASGYVISTVPIVKSGVAPSDTQGPIIENVMKFRATSDARRLGRVTGTATVVPVSSSTSGGSAPTTTVGRRYRRITPTYLGPLESRHLFLPVQINNFR